MANLSREKVVQQWCALVEGGAGKDRWVIDKTEKLIKEASPPPVSSRREAVSSGLFGEKRDFLIVTHKALREYAMFIGARDFGRNLDVAWYVTVNPGFMKRQLSKYVAAGNPNALSANLDIFAQQDLSAYVKLTDDCLQKTINQLLDELKLDYSTIDRKSKGFLAVW